MAVKQNKEIVRNFCQTVLVDRQLDQVAQFMRDPLNDVDSTGQSEALTHVKQHYSTYFTAFPDLKTTIDDVTGENDLISCRMTFSGTQQGEYMGHAPTWKPFSVTLLQVFRITNGKIVERWEWIDGMGIRNQLGIQN